MKVDQLTVFQPFFEDKMVAECFQLYHEAKLDSSKENQFVASLLQLSEQYSLDTNLFQSLITYLLSQNENVFTLSLERKQVIPDTLKAVVLMDLALLYEYYHESFDFLSAQNHDIIINLKSSKPVVNIEIHNILRLLQSDLDQCVDVESFYERLKQHYLQYGVGKYGLNKAFRILENNIIPIVHIGENQLEDLIGYESQKKQLTDNTEAFLSGSKANNVLLYGDAGTGKSSSIKALLNRYYKDGLRMIEIYKHQFQYLPSVIHELQSRNYKFVIFMDDLSFEEFETDYKYLKAVIEGGLEKKPDNILIYATSNRRHLIKQSWSERAGEDDININDALQEKTSLASRFGIKINFVHPNRFEFLKIVDGLAKRYHIEMDEKELHEKALTWEIRHGGFTGRTAKQFIHTLIKK